MLSQKYTSELRYVDAFELSFLDYYIMCVNFLFELRQKKCL